MIEDQMEMAEAVLERLQAQGFDRKDLPGPGDLADAIQECGYILALDPTHAGL